MSGIKLIIQNYDAPTEAWWSVNSLAYLTQCVGLGLFAANIIQYIIDQLVGASADELNTVIYWHCAALPLKSLLLSFATCFDAYKYLNLIMFILSGVAVSLVLVSHSFFKHKLENISLIKNPIKLIVRVLCYARKHKYPENRSALTYWEEKAPSRIDLGKDKYGGPFTVEEVEDVKTVFRIIPIFIAIIGYSLSAEHYYLDTSFLVCVLSNGALHTVCSLLLILIYLYFVRVFFYKYIPSMLRRMSLGLVFALLSRIPYLLPFLSSIFTQVVSQTLLGISYILVNPVSLEFIVAQSPVQTRGLMVGIWCASWQIGFDLKNCLSLIFHCQYQDNCINFYYHLTKCVLLFIIFIVFVILAKRYKYRVRENEVNIVQIVDRTYQNYFKQEEEYNNQENNIDIISVVN
uniref:Major facilitator superfamily associated domain-containing protein n=1 Tax=Amphimedon queenslandica TaxID=400682 RepID=A0A1X7ULE2_AMPQE